MLMPASSFLATFLDSRHPKTSIKSQFGASAVTQWPLPFPSVLPDRCGSSILAPWCLMTPAQANAPSAYTPPDYSAALTALQVKNPQTNLSITSCAHNKTSYWSTNSSTFGTNESLAKVSKMSLKLHSVVCCHLDFFNLNHLNFDLHNLCCS